MLIDTHSLYFEIDRHGNLDLSIFIPLLGGIDFWSLPKGLYMKAEGNSCLKLYTANNYNYFTLRRGECNYISTHFRLLFK